MCAEGATNPRPQAVSFELFSTDMGPFVAYVSGRCLTGLMQISTDAILEHAAAVAALNGVDPESLTGDEAAAWVGAVARIRTASEAVIAVLGRRLEELSTVDAGRDRYARSKGFAGAPTLLAQTGQMSTGEANRMLSLGRAMADADAGLGADVLLVGATEETVGETRVLFEAVTQGVAGGTLAPDKAAMIRQLLETLSAPTVTLERALVALAARLTAVELGRRCDRELAADHEALRDRDRRHKARRYAAFFRDGDGMLGFRGRLDAVTGAPFVTWIEGEVRKQMGTERDLPDGERRDEGQIRADVFAAMANHAIGCQDPASGTKTVMVVQVTKESLESGVGAATCHGLSGPISIGALRQMAVDLAVIPAVMGGSSLPLDLGRATRCFTPAQRIAIALRDKGCAKCGAPVNRCDVHHIKFWSLEGLSDINNGLMLCVGCHHRLHDFGWIVEIIDGEVWFIPPATTDPARERIPSCSTRLKLGSSATASV